MYIDRRLQNFGFSINLIELNLLINSPVYWRFLSKKLFYRYQINDSKVSEVEEKSKDDTRIGLSGREGIDWRQSGKISDLLK